MWIALVLAGAVAAEPQPSPTPLKTITNVHSTPFCTAFGENIRYSIEGVLTNDDLFKRTEPVFLKAARDMVSGGELVSSFNSLKPAQAAGNNASMSLDIARLEEMSGAIAKNLETINKLLNDPSRFPKQAKTEDEKRLVKLRAQLLELAKHQNDELNILSGTTEQYLFDNLYDMPVSAGGTLSANGQEPAGNTYFGGGPLNKTPGAEQAAGGSAMVNGRTVLNAKPPGQNVVAVAGDPELLQNDLFMNSAMGRLYKALAQTEIVQSSMEQPFARDLVQASASCQ